MRITIKNDYVLIGSSNGVNGNGIYETFITSAMGTKLSIFLLHFYPPSSLLRYFFTSLLNPLLEPTIFTSTFQPFYWQQGFRCLVRSCHRVISSILSSTLIYTEFFEITHPRQRVSLALILLRFASFPTTAIFFHYNCSILRFPFLTFFGKIYIRKGLRIEWK